MDKYHLNRWEIIGYEAGQSWLNINKTKEKSARKEMMFRSLPISRFRFSMTRENLTPSELEALLGEQLKAERLRKNLTMEVVAERAAVSVSTVRALESGKGSRVESLIRVVRALGRTDWLTSLQPPVKISPLQMANLGRRKRQRASRVTGDRR